MKGPRQTEVRIAPRGLPTAICLLLVAGIPSADDACAQTSGNIVYNPGTPVSAPLVLNNYSGADQELVPENTGDLILKGNGQVVRSESTTQISSGTSPVTPSSGAGVEISYDTDASSDEAEIRSIERTNDFFTDMLVKAAVLRFFAGSDDTDNPSAEAMRVESSGLDDNFSRIGVNMAGLTLEEEFTIKSSGAHDSGDYGAAVQLKLEGRDMVTEGFRGAGVLFAPYNGTNWSVRATTGSGVAHVDSLMFTTGSSPPEGDTDIMVLEDNGNVGIGVTMTAEPDERLHVKGGAFLLEPTSGDAIMKVGTSTGFTMQVDSDSGLLMEVDISRHSTSLGEDASTGSADDAVSIGYGADALYNGGVSIGTATTSNLYGVSIGHTVLSSAGGVSIGKNALSAASAVAIGEDSISDGGLSVAIGVEADADSPGSIAIGRESTITEATSAIAIGAYTWASGHYSTAVGSYAVTSGYDSAAFGRSAAATGTEALAAGHAAYASAEGAVALGTDSTAAGTAGVAVGPVADASAAFSAAFGPGATASGSTSLALGVATASGVAAVAIGNGSSAAHDEAIALGPGSTTTAVNQMVIGGAAYPISDVYIGDGVVSGSPDDVTINASGANDDTEAGANLKLAGGRGKGTGDGGKVMILTAPDDGGSGVLNDLETAVVVDQMKNVIIGGGSSAGTMAGAVILTDVQPTVTPTPPANGAGIYAQGAPQLRGFDSTGNDVGLTPHRFDLHTPPSAHPYPWEYNATNRYLGKQVSVDMAALVTAVEQETGQTFTHWRDFTPADWYADQVAAKAAVEAQRTEDAINSTWVEIDISEAVEVVAETETEETVTEVAEWVFDAATGSVTQVVREVTVRSQVPTGNSVYAIKDGVRMDKATGKFFRRPMATEVEIEPYEIKDPPAWMAERMFQ